MTGLGEHLSNLLSSILIDNENPELFISVCELIVRIIE